MATIYCRAHEAEEVMQLLAQAVNEWHKPIATHEVRVGVLWATSDNKMEPPLKKDGYPVLGSIRRLSTDWRVLTGLDAVLKVDESTYTELGDETRLAMVDHFLAHVAVIIKPGSTECKRDVVGRPKLRIRKGNWHGSEGFQEVVKRHGKAAVEFIHAQHIYGSAKASLEPSGAGHERQSV